MKISQLTSAQRAIVDSNSNLRLYLQNLEKGQPPTPHSWLYEDVPSTEILERWLKKLAALENGSPRDKLIYEFDCKQIEKYGPQGEVPPIEKALQVESFQEQYIPNTECGIELSPLSEIYNFRQNSLNYWQLGNVIEDMSSRDTLVTNSGWPLFTRRQLVVSQSIESAQSMQALDFPAIILFRSYNGKLRVVWMYPMAMNLLEYQATMPIQRLLSGTKYCTPWIGFDAVKRRFTELWAAHPYAFGGDTTAMDAHMQRSQLQMVGRMCADLFPDPSLMLRSLYHVSDIDLVVGENAIIRKILHGIASGSGWTQLSETTFQIGMHHQYRKQRNLPGTVEDGMGIGDDYVWFFDSPVDSDDVVRFWAENGLPGKPEKQSNYEDHCTFLQRLFIKGYPSRDESTVLGGIYPTVRALNSLVNPEKWHKPSEWNSDMFCARCFMILENCVDHPLFEQFSTFVAHGHRDLIPFAKKSAAELNQIQRQARRVRGLNPSYNQEKLGKPLASFTSINYVKEL